MDGQIDQRLGQAVRVLSSWHLADWLLESLLVTLPMCTLESLCTPNMTPRANQQTDMFTADAGPGTRKHTLLYGD